MNNKLLSLIFASSFVGMAFAEEAPKAEKSKSELVAEYVQINLEQTAKTCETTMESVKDKLPKEAFDQTEKVMNSVISSDKYKTFITDLVSENFSEKEIKELIEVAKKDVTKKMLDAFAKSQIKMQEIFQEEFTKSLTPPAAPIE